MGIRLRQLRKSKHRSLREVAAASQVSESFLSQIERGLTSPSIASLRRICSALGENMGALFAEEFDSSATDARLVRVADRRRIFRPDGSADYLLTPPLAKHLEIHYNVVAPGRSSGTEPYTHEGEEECVHVLDGTLQFQWNGNTYDLHAGDAILIDPKIGHSFANITDRSAVVLWIISPARSDI
ncbi:cupin domain-containing protein [Leucobacter sp. USHLN153]|uniref:cupin domain-containing protein n=1 Tax=Leucobacter sp. USHLN153 TaxID=3081268 RepID=UPI0030184F77